MSRTSCDGAVRFEITRWAHIMSDALLTSSHLLARGGTQYLQPCLLPRASIGVLRSDVKDAVGVDAERDLDLEVAARFGVQLVERELAERLVLAEPPRLTAAAVDIDQGLVVARGREHARLLDRNRRVLFEQALGVSAGGLDRERRGVDVEQHRARERALRALA